MGGRVKGRVDEDIGVGDRSQISGRLSVNRKVPVDLKEFEEEKSKSCPKSKFEERKLPNIIDKNSSEEKEFNNKNICCQSSHQDLENNNSDAEAQGDEFTAHFRRNLGNIQIRNGANSVEHSPVIDLTIRPRRNSRCVTRRLEDEDWSAINVGTIKSICDFIYFIPVLILYLLNSGDDCGTGMKTIILVEIILRLCFFNCIRLVLLALAKYWRHAFYGYAVFAILKFFLMLFWNLVLIILFSISSGNCKKESVMIWIASLLLCVLSTIEILSRICFLVFTLLLLNYLSHNIRRTRPKVRNKKFLQRLPKFKQLKINEYKEDKECIICLCKFDTKSPPIFLPCGNNHMFHRPCIKSWLRRKPNCPICKRAVTRRNINNACTV
ncbi:unnamed protein product [Moneuplotes crassus]|uniref:RING-type domain-containing protein n=1 Tax=Euplotes crassus TaxID=5936 RepID=A0AAD1ULV1_EUPCR|nr:unnamed protein product [Moneuplotes crassus]